MVVRKQVAEVVAPEEKGGLPSTGHDVTPVDDATVKGVDGGALRLPESNKRPFEDLPVRELPTPPLGARGDALLRDEPDFLVNLRTALEARDAAGEGDGDGPVEVEAAGAHAVGGADDADADANADAEGADMAERDMTPRERAIARDNIADVPLNAFNPERPAAGLEEANWEDVPEDEPDEVLFEEEEAPWNGDEWDQIWEGES
jgi:hypothetical protein